MIRSFLSIDEAITFWNKVTPRLACDYMLYITCKKSDATQDPDNIALEYAFVPILNFTIPEAGLKLQSVDGSTHLHPEVVAPATMDITFATIRDYDMIDQDKREKRGEKYPSESGIDTLFYLWTRQFHTNGLPRFIKESQRPEIGIMRIKGEYPTCTSTYSALAGGSHTGGNSTDGVMDTSESNLNSHAMIRMTGCHFSYPRPTNMSQSSTEVATYSMTVSYSDIILKDCQ